MPDSLVQNQISRQTKFGHFTWPQVTVGLVIWLGLYAVGSIFVSNPFWVESSASAALNYAHAMYLHGLLIGLAGLVSLVACELFELSFKMRQSILLATVAATFLAGIGGIFDRSLQDTFWLWVQIFSFFCLDDILLSLVIGFVLVHNQTLRRSMTYWIAMVASISFFIAAVIGHVAGWILDFGNWPGIIGWWAKLNGESVDTFLGNLITSHSHEIIVAILALLIAMISWRFRSRQAGVRANVVALVGEWFVLIGTILMTFIYVVAAFTANQPPNFFVHGPNGLAGDDLVTGIGVMIGGLLVIWGTVFGQRDGAKRTSVWLQPTLLSIALTWLFLVITVVAGGFAIELNETRFGAGGPGPLAVNDAVFTFIHQDVAFFLFPAIITVVLIAHQWLKPEMERFFQRIMLIAVIITFIGTLTYAFMAPRLFGVGYWITTLGFIMVCIAVAYFCNRLLSIVGHAQSASPGFSHGEVQ